jgi:parallel beta-helix repeat protein
MIYNVKDFGAFGNGSNDDTVAIQRAINAAATQGGTVLAPRGVYVISASLLLLDRVTLTGQGMGQTIFRLVANLGTNLNGLIRTDGQRGTHYASLRDLTLDGNRQTQTGGDQIGFYCGAAADQRLTDSDIGLYRVEARGFSAYGFNLRGLVTRLQVTDCLSYDNGQDGFTLDGVQTTSLRGCQSFLNGRHGFNLAGGTSTTLLSQSLAYDNGGNGFTLQAGTRMVQLNSSEARGNAGDGIYCVESDQNAFFNNMVLANREYGIRLRGSQGASLIGNLLRGNGQAEHNRYSEIMLDDSETLPTTDTMVANNNIFCVGDVRARYGIQETAGDGERIQTRNTFLANRVLGAVTNNFQFNGRAPMLDGNL